MKKFAPLLLALSLWAADPWQSKPFTEWSDKDVQKILTNSPWAHSISIGGDPGVPERSLSGREDSGNHPAGANSATGPGIMAPGGQEAGRERRTDPDALNPDRQATVLMVVWQSALPVKQALVRRKYAAEAATSPEAKKFLDENANYLIAVSGLTPALSRAPQLKSDILQRTTLAAKGKEPLHPVDILVSPSNKVTEAIFVFPKTSAFTLTDKDVEFSTQLGPVAVKNKFHLKDMLVNGTLQL